MVPLVDAAVSAAAGMTLTLQRNEDCRAEAECLALTENLMSNFPLDARLRGRLEASLVFMRQQGMAPIGTHLGNAMVEADKLRPWTFSRIFAPARINRQQDTHKLVKLWFVPEPLQRLMVQLRDTLHMSYTTLLVAARAYEVMPDVGDAWAAFCRLSNDGSINGLLTSDQVALDFFTDILTTHTHTTTTEPSCPLTPSRPPDSR